jgi:hypothetical protein
MLLPGYVQLEIPLLCYVLYCLFVSLVVRIVMTFFRVLIPISKSQSGRSFFKRWWIEFEGVSGGQQDYWLSFWIGFAEAFSYPAIILSKELLIIGGWIGIKTAGNWRIREKNRPVFHRFLLGNLITLGFSYFWGTKYITLINCN